LLLAAKVDGAIGSERFTTIMLALMKLPILVALLFCMLEAFWIFNLQRRIVAG
jgi:ABC-type sugar transport system permease subunit